MYVAGNRFLGALSISAREQILAACTMHQLPLGTFLYRPAEHVSHVFFLVHGVASVVLPMAEGDTAELLLIGAEGVTGAGQLLGPAKGQASCFMQLPGAGYRIRFSALASLFQASDEIRVRLLEYLQYSDITVSQIAGCNRLHVAEGRLARWLLMAYDRTESVELHFTQEFVAQMLGVQRTTVTAIAGSLHDTGLIRYSRGCITILDLQGLNRVACSCAAIIHDLFGALYQAPIPLQKH